MKEIERKFLPATDCTIPFTSDNEDIVQFYVQEEGEETLCRVRLVDDHKAFITQKSKSTDGGFSCDELESRIPYLMGVAMEKTRTGLTVVKERYRIPHGALVFEVDVFSEENNGLVVIEIELPSKDTHVDLPDWVGEEVTFDPKYKNVNLVQTPFNKW